MHCGPDFEASSRSTSIDVVLASPTVQRLRHTSDLAGDRLIRGPLGRMFIRDCGYRTLAMQSIYRTWAILLIKSP